jgi:hypothetical protein
MREILAFKKETDNKIRWDAKYEGAPFELYIPKWRIPEPAPEKISVKIYLPTDTVPVLKKHDQTDIGAKPALRDEPIMAELSYCREHTETIRYDPIGDDKTWEIGHPYIPKGLLPVQPPGRMILVIEWLK